MSGRRWYDGDGYGLNHNNDREAARNNHGPQYRDYGKLDRSTDYVPRPKYSNSGHTSPSPADHYRPSERDTHRNRSPGSDYIVQSDGDQDDYICSDTPASFRHASGNDDRYDGGFSRRSPIYYPSTKEVDSRSDVDYSPDPAAKSNYQYLKEGGWEHKHEFMRSHGLKTWEHDDYQEANEILDKYRELDAESDYASADEYRKRAGSAECDMAHGRRGSDYEDREIDERASDIASYYSDAQSGRLSRTSTAAESGFASPHAARRSSDYAPVPTSGYGDALPRRSSNCSDYAPVSGRSMPLHSDTGSSDDNGIAEGSDYMSSDDAQSDICRKPGSDGSASDDNGVAEGSDYASSDDSRSDVCSNPSSNGGSDKSGDEGDYMSDDREDCMEDDDGSDINGDED
jgi:hypothetical protein